MSSSLQDDLRAVGVEVDSVWDLVNTRASYRPAIPVLLDWLTSLDSRGVAPSEVNKLREGIARALSVREARPSAAPALIEQMKAMPHEGPGWQGALWALGAALGFVADDSVFDDVVALACDRDLGPARQMLTEALARMRSPEATDVLIGLVEDGDVGGHALWALGRRGDKRSRVVLEANRDDPRAWVRQSVRKGLARLDAAASNE